MISEGVQIIDVWDVRTFDAELLGQLESNAELIGDYLRRDNQILVEYDLHRGPGGPTRRPTNEYADKFCGLLDAIDLKMKDRTIRAFHYTRLTDDEVAELWKHGIQLSTQKTLRQRLDAVVASGCLDRDIADRLYEKSPFHSDQLDGRQGKFWLISGPAETGYDGVGRFLELWGGEVASWWVKECELLAPLRALGRPRVIEVAVPLRATLHSHIAGETVVKTFARSHAKISRKQGFDLYLVSKEPASIVLRIHTEGEATFEAVGRSYPKSKADVDAGSFGEIIAGED